MVAFYAVHSAPGPERDPQRRFVPDVDWPPHPAEIAALVDLSMSLPTIAYYLGTPESRVAALLDYYGIQIPANSNIGEAIDPGLRPQGAVLGFESLLQRLVGSFR
jgi:hypothetical protein